MKKKKLYWTIQITVWTLFVSIQVLGRAIYSESDDLRVVFFLVEGLLFFFATHYFRTMIKKWEWTKLPMFRAVPRVLVTVIFLGLAVYFIRIFLSIPLGLYDPVSWKFSQILGLSSVYAVIFFIWMVLYFAYHYFMQYNQALKQDAAIMEIELNNLKSQLNPHFIFNSLNGIRALIDENPKNSKKAITQLSNILRTSLVSDKKRLTTFSDELEMVFDYLGLESIRYEERLRVKYEIHPQSGKFLIPPLMLQTLVENAIKHGISQLMAGGLLQLKTLVENNHLIIEIRNSGQYNSEAKSTGTGLGVTNTKRRLEMIFGDKAKFYLQNEDDKTVLTYLKLPKMDEL